MLFFYLISLVFLQEEHSANWVILDAEWDVMFNGRNSDFLKAMHTCYGIPAWSSWACGGHGSCTDEDYCICKIPFKGKNCTQIDFTHKILGTFMISQDPDSNRNSPLPHCNGIRIDQQGACGEVNDDGISHFGVCVLHNVCRCYCGWSGIDCEEFDYDDYKDEINCLKPYTDKILKEN